MAEGSSPDRFGLGLTDDTASEPQPGHFSNRITSGNRLPQSGHFGSTGSPSLASAIEPTTAIGRLTAVRLHPLGAR